MGRPHDSTYRGPTNEPRFSTNQRSLPNMRISTISALKCIGLGTMLGFVAARQEVTLSTHANAAPSAQAVTHEKMTSPLNPAASCCDVPGRLLAFAAPTAPSVASGAQQRKPNIVVIIG